MREGGPRVLGWGRYTTRHPVTRRVIARWERGHDALLVLGTGLSWNRRKVVEAFNLGMSIEELFRDDITYGWGLRQTRVGATGG